MCSSSTPGAACLSACSWAESVNRGFFRGCVGFSSPSCLSPREEGRDSIRLTPASVKTPRPDLALSPVPSYVYAVQPYRGGRQLGSSFALRVFFMMVLFVGSGLLVCTTGTAVSLNNDRAVGYWRHSDLSRGLEFDGAIRVPFPVFPVLGSLGGHQRQSVGTNPKTLLLSGGCSSYQPLFFVT